MAAKSSNNFDVYLEVGKKRVFAGALDWPGWCRSGKDEEAALNALLEYGSRYAHTVQPSQLAFQAPVDVSAFSIVERLEGNATTDFGAPGMAPSSDVEPVNAGQLERFQSLLKAFWHTLDQAGQAARGRELRKGPRGGGRELDDIIRHVLDADAGYLNQLGWKLKLDAEADLQSKMERTLVAVLEGLSASVQGEIPAEGPRGGRRWTPRYFVRRLAWHTLDHAWEIEDRIL